MTESRSATLTLVKTIERCVDLLAGLTMRWDVIVDVWVCVAALSFSAVVGLLSGIYPALKAAGMDPMEAIRQQ